MLWKTHLATVQTEKTRAIQYKFPITKFHQKVISYRLFLRQDYPLFWVVFRREL